MRSFIGICAVGFVLTFSGQGEAQLVAFNELAPTDIPILGSVVCANGTGFRFVSEHLHLIGGGLLADFTSNGTTHIGYESGRGFPIAMERVGGGTFSLLSLDAAEFYSSPTDRPDAEMLTVTGFQQGGQTVSHTFNIDGIRDGAGGVEDFEHFVLPDTFANLTSVVFTGLRAGNLSGGVAIDNIEYQLAVPEVLAACVAVPLPPDTPTVSITSPLAGNVIGTVLIEATATDDVGVVSVQFKLDGGDLGEADAVPPYSVSWDTTAVADGPHTVTAEARDAANNVVTASVVVTVRNYTVPNATPHYVDFDGIDDYVQVADANGLSFGNGVTDTPMTLETWFRPDAMVRHQLLGKWDSSRSEYKLHIASGVIRLDLYDNSARATVSVFTSSQVALLGTWHHLAVTYDGRGGATAADGITFFIDGVAASLLRFNNAAYVAMENLTAPLQIGREGPNWKQYDGGLDEVRLWNVALTPAEIQASMTTELSGAEPGLVAYWRFNEGAGATVADDSPGEQAATIFNGTTWVPGGPMAPVGPDVTAPDISNILTSNLTDSSITVTFGTSEVATGWVSYRLNLSSPETAVYSASSGTTHLVTLTGLAPDTVYLFEVNARDAAGNLQVGPPMSFRTLVPLPDAIPPTVAVVRPPASGSVSGTAVVVEATATDNVGVVSVQFKLDGVDLGEADAVPPYSVSWDTTAVADGQHTVTAEARDAANNVGTASRLVNVANTPVTTTPHYVDFDGIDDYVQVADANGLSFGNGVTDTAMTFETWFRPDAMVRHQLLGKWDSSRSEYKLHIASGVIRLDLYDGSARATVSAFTSSQMALLGTWHHLAVTYDGRGGATAADGITFFIDGVAAPLLRFNNAAYVAMENLTAPLQIGREGPNWKQYDGGLDEVRLWNVALTPDQIRESMTTGLSGVEPGLVAYWRFNEGAGATVADDSPGEQAATLFNGATWVPGGPMAPVGPM